MITLKILSLTACLGILITENSFVSLQQVGLNSDLFNTFTPIYRSFVSIADENAILISTDVFNDRYDCFSKCNSRLDCKMISFRINQCKLYNQIRYSTNLSTTEGPFLFEKYYDNYSSINSFLTNFWPFNGDPSDIVGRADLYGGVNVSYVNDRLNRPNSAVYLNNGYYKIPSGTYCSGDFTVSLWLKIHSFNYFSRIIELTVSGTARNRVVIIFSQGNNGKPSFYVNYDIIERFISSSISPKLNKWNHFAFTLKADYGVIYLNGNIVAQGTINVARSINRNINFIGRSIAYPSDADANAVYDDMKFFNKSLTQTEILKVLNSYY